MLIATLAGCGGTTADVTGPTGGSAPVVASLEFTSVPDRGIVDKALPAIVLQLTDGSGRVVTAPGSTVLVRIVSTSGSSLDSTRVDFSSGQATIGSLASHQAGVFHLVAMLATGGTTLSATTSSFSVEPAPVALDSSVVQAVADSSGSRVTLSGQVSGLKVDSGTVVVGTQGQGFLRQVVSVQNNGSSLILNTKPATLNQVVQDGTLSTAVLLSTEPWNRTPSNIRHWATTPPSNATFPFGSSLDLGTLSLTSPDGESSLSLSSGLDFNGTGDLELQIEGFQTKNFAFTVDGDVTLTEKLLASMKTEFEAKDTITKPLFRQPYLVLIGGFPVIVSFNGDLQLIPSVSAGAGLEYGITSQVTRHVHLGFNFDGQQWTHNASADPSGAGTDPTATPFVDAPINIGAGLEAKVKVGVALYDASEAYTFLDGATNFGAAFDASALTIEATCDAAASLGLGIGLSSDVSGLLSQSTLGFPLEIPDYETSQSLGSIRYCDHVVELAPTTAVVIGGTSGPLVKGATRQLTAQPEATFFGSTRPVTRAVAWSSDNAAVATVSSLGLVTAISAGVANIRATTDGVNGSTSIQVDTDVVVGHLTVSVSGLPAGTPAAIQVTSTTNAQYSVPSSSTLDLTPGTYTITARAVTTNGLTYTPTPASQTATITANATDSAAVMYSPPMSGTLTLNPASCTIAAGASNCTIGISWTTTNPVGTSAVTSNYPSANTTVATGNSGSASNVAVPYGGRSFYLYNDTTLLDTKSATAACAAGTSWSGSACQFPPSGTLTLNPARCTIAAGASSCTIGMSWTTTYPVGTSAVTSNYPSVNTTVATGNSGSASNVAVPYGGRTFYLYNNTTLLATKSATAACTAGAIWNGSTCQLPPPSGTLTLNPASCTIAAGASSCTIGMSWTTTYPVGTSAVTSNYPSANTTVATGNSGSASNVAVPYGGRSFYLYNNATLLATTSATAGCTAGTSWNGSACR